MMLISTTREEELTRKSGYMLTPPKTLLDSNRPAYGGTCYSQWPLSSSAYVEVFGSASPSGTILITASTPGFANYAHVIDGIAVSTSAPTSSRSGSPSSQESVSRSLEPTKELLLLRRF